MSPLLRACLLCLSLCAFSSFARAAPDPISALPAPFAVPLPDAAAPSTITNAPIDPTAPIAVTLPSALPSGDARNDGIALRFFAARGAVPPQGAPAIVLLPYLGATDAPEFDRFGRYLAARGVSAVVMTLPFHGKRAVGVAPANFYINSDVDLVVKTWNQAASDVSTTVTWLEAQPNIDRTRIAGAGVSLGALVLHLSMGRDARLGAGVAFLGGGDLPLIFRRSLLTKLRLRGRRGLTAEEEAKLRTVDPLSYAQFNRPRRVLMVEGARDFIVPPRAAQELWEALGRPPIRWLPVNHLALQFAEPQVRRATFTFLQAVWQGKTDVHAPGLFAPTLKVGFLSGLDSRVTPAVTLEAFTLGHGLNHLPLVEFNVGLSGRGPFAGVATPISQFADIGLARRLNGSKFRPYVSFHVGF